MLEEGTGPAAQLLNHLGITVEQLREEWLRVTGTEL